MATTPPARFAPRTNPLFDQFIILIESSFDYDDLEATVTAYTGAEYWLVHPTASYEFKDGGRLLTETNPGIPIPGVIMVIGMGQIQVNHVMLTEPQVFCNH